MRGVTTFYIARNDKCQISSHSEESLNKSFNEKVLDWLFLDYLTFEWSPAFWTGEGRF